jgi:hypothetical protein
MQNIKTNGFAAGIADCNQKGNGKKHVTASGKNQQGGND